MQLPDIRYVSNPRFWLPIAAAACLVDTAGLFVWRYTSAADAPINSWYDRFGLAAYGADILSMMIGIVLAQLVSSWMGGSGLLGTGVAGPWSPFMFCVIAVAIQMAHDLFFATVVVPAVPKGRNAIMDLMMEYTHISFPQGILIVDAIYMILVALITMVLASVDSSVAWMTLLVTLYTTTYVLYTRPSQAPDISAIKTRDSLEGAP